MSVKVKALAWDAALQSSSRKLVMLKMADHADEHGCHVFPSVDSIANQTHLNARTVQRVLQAFLDEGLIAVTRPGGGRRRATEYAINVRRLFDLGRPQKGDTVSPFDSETGEKRHPEKGDTVSGFDGKTPAPDPERVTPGPETPAQDHPNHHNRQEPSLDAREAFEKFWDAAAPKQTHRSDAVKAFHAILAEGVDARVLIDAITGQRLKEKARATEWQFLAPPAKFLADRRWEAKPKASAAPKDRVFVEKGSAEWDAWAAWRKAEGKPMHPGHDTRNHGLGGGYRTGWWFETALPPAHDAQEVA